MSRLRLIEPRDPIHDVIPALEKVLEERDRERAKAILRRFIPQRYQWLFDELVSKTGKGT